MAQLMTELLRLHTLQGLEGLLAGAGFSRVAGVDEAGRGCLAGPVVAAAMIPHPDRLVPGVDDSKLLPAERRERLAVAIRQACLASAVVAVSPATIDRVNILEATRLAMRRALGQLDPGPDCVLIDAVALQGLPYPCLPVVRGDQLCYAVACASILAKVERDRLMCALDRRYPRYGFAEHKGYAAPRHLQALRELGPSPEHRLTFHSVLPRRAENLH